MPDREAQEYCNCGRGLVIGIMTSQASDRESRLTFFPIVSRNADYDENAADLRCLDCVADAVAALASGETRTRMQTAARARQKQMQDLSPKAPR